MLEVRVQDRAGGVDLSGVDTKLRVKIGGARCLFDRNTIKSLPSFPICLLSFLSISRLP